MEIRGFDFFKDWAENGLQIQKLSIVILILLTLSILDWETKDLREQKQVANLRGGLNHDLMMIFYKKGINQVHFIQSDYTPSDTFYQMHIKMTNNYRHHSLLLSSCPKISWFMIY